MNRHTRKANFSLAVKLELLRRGLTVSALAEKLGRNRSVVSGAIHHNRFPRLRRQLADFLQLH